MAFNCSICGEESTRICVWCTKDTCANHLCAKCGRCSDCCECEVPLDEEVHVPPAAHEAAPVQEPATPIGEPTPPAAEPEPPIEDPPPSPEEPAPPAEEPAPIPSAATDPEPAA